MKEKDFDEEAVISGMDDMENIKQEFDNKIRELTGQSDEMPWEKGPQQFQKMEMSPGVTRYLPQKAVQAVPVQETAPSMNGEPSGQTCNMNGVEYPGPCSNNQGGSSVSGGNQPG